MPIGNGPDVSGFLDKLDLVGKNPLTYIAFLMLIVGWVGAWYFFHKRVYPKILEKISPDQRSNALQLLVLGLPNNITDNRLKILRWRYLILAYGMTLVVFLILAGLFAYYWTRPEEKTSAVVVDALADQKAKLRQIVQSTEELQKLTAAQRASRELLSGVVLVKRKFALSFSPEVQTRAQELQRLIDDYLTKVDVQTLPEADQRQLALARAEAAFALRELDKAIQLADPKTAEQLVEQGRELEREGAERFRLIGRSLHGLKRWRDAANAFESTLKTPFGNSRDRVQLATCYWSLGDQEMALANCERAITSLVDSKTDRSPEDDMLLGIAHLLRASMWNDRYEDAKASPEYGRAAVLFEGQRVAPLFVKSFPGQATIGQEFVVAHCHLGRAAGLFAIGAARERTSAFAEVIRRLQSLARNPLLATLPGGGVDHNYSIDPVSRPLVEEILATALFSHANCAILDVTQSNGVKRASDEAVSLLDVAHQDIEQAIPLFEGLKKEDAVKGGRLLMVQVLTTRAAAFQERGDYRKCLNDNQEILQVLGVLRDKHGAFNPVQYFAGSCLAAWILAAAPDDELRDGKKAILLASAATKALGSETFFVLDVLAAAHAELGDFRAAVEHQTRALALAPAVQKAQLTERLNLYRDSKPYRIPPKPELGPMPRVRP